MYKLLLCWRYLRTRYIALVCIVSVMLGVATMIVVNSVMAGFTHEMQNRLNGLLGDVILTARSMDGAYDPDAHMAKFREVAGDSIEGMSPVLRVPSLMYLTVGGEPHARQVELVGIDEATYSSVSKFGEYLQHPTNRQQLDFHLREGGYDVIDHQADDPSTINPREEMQYAGWKHRRNYAEVNRMIRERAKRSAESTAAQEAAKTGGEPEIQDPFAAMAAQSGEPQGRDFNPATEQHTGIVLGIGVYGYRGADNTDRFLGIPGDDVKVAFPLAVMPPKITSQEYTIVDFYECKMSEYDSRLAFVPLKTLQRDRGMIDPKTGKGKFTSIQIKIKPGINGEAVRDRIQAAFPIQSYYVGTWRDEQGPLLAAVQLETAILNVLLFMIIAVAGFGIFAIFLMIVVEKTRDIGILKSLGASAWGVMGIFLVYGLSLGLVGAGAGTALGLVIVAWVNELAGFVGWILGQPVFDPSVYYLYKIPSIVEPLTVALIVVGAIVISVVASVVPAMRAARLHPVKALRF